MVCVWEQQRVWIGPWDSNDGFVKVPDPQDGVLYLLTCRDPASGQVLSRLNRTYETPAPAVTGIDVAQAAMATLTAPTPTFETSPPHERDQVVGLRTWIWLIDAVQPQAATASIDGVSATVTATPTAVRIDPGDGSAAFTCTNASTPYDPAHPDRVPGCSHLYQRRSTSDAQPNGTYTMTVTVAYDVTWAATTGEAGSLTPIQATAQLDLVVREIQALIN